MLYNLFNRCLNTEYTHTHLGGSYSLQPAGETLYIFFEWSNGFTDWIFNFLFPRRKIKPYEGMKTTWKCHRGFLKVWDSVKREIGEQIIQGPYEEIIIVGYSHGAALATLCHEFIWFNRPDLRGKIHSYGFGCPRVFAGKMTEDLRIRWEGFKAVNIKWDLVSHLPPRIFGFKNVGSINILKGLHNYSPIDAHRPETYLHELRQL